MPSTAPAPTGRRRDLAVGLALLAVAVAVGAWVWTRSAPMARRVPPPALVLDQEVPRGTDGVASVRLRVVGPTVLRVELTAPAGTEAKAGPERPVELEPRDLPDPTATTAWTHAGGTATHEVAAYTSGMYVLHLRPSADGRLHVRVTTSDWRGGTTRAAK